MAAVMHRVAMATLSNPDRLLEALTDLKAIPIDFDDMCCIGTRTSLQDTASALASRAEAHPELLSVVRNVEPLAFIPAGPEILATTDRWLTKVKSRTAQPPSVSEPAACWLTQRNRASLVEQLQKGDIALLVNAPNSQLWSLGTQALLRHSSTPVHGLMRPWPGLSGI